MLVVPGCFRRHWCRSAGPGPAVSRGRAAVRRSRRSQVWNRQRTDTDLVDPANTGLGHRPVARWNLPEGWVISVRPAHPAIVSEADYIAAQDLSARRGPDSPAGRCYRLADCCVAGAAGGSWSPAGQAAKRPTGAATATPAPPAQTAPGRRTPTSAKPRSCPASPPWLSSYAARSRPAAARSRAPRTARFMPGGRGDYLLQASSTTLTYNPHERTLRADTQDAAAITIDQKSSTKAYLPELGRGRVLPWPRSRPPRRSRLSGR